VTVREGEKSEGVYESVKKRFFVFMCAKESERERLCECVGVCV